MRTVITNSLCLCLIISLFCRFSVGATLLVNWHDPVEQLAHKIVAVTGPGAVAVTIENHSSLTKKDFDSISNSLKVEMEALGARTANPDQAAALLKVSLSENPLFYVWVAQIQQGSSSSVVIVSLPRPAEAGLRPESVPIILQKTPLWAQQNRILDVLILEEDTSLKQIAVLDEETVAIYRRKNGSWQQEQNLSITHSRPWPRDLHGRMLGAKGHLLDIYLPGVYCRTTTSLPLALSCRDSDDPWPLTTAAGTLPATDKPNVTQPLGAFYASSRNFFTGALAPGIVKLTTISKFYSAASLPRDKYRLWIFQSTDGQTHFVDGLTDQTAKLGWGSEIASIKTMCGSGWQVLATGASDPGTDTVRAYEIADRDPAPVSAPLELSGEITAMWTASTGDSTIAVVKDQETGEYEAFRLGMDCSQ